MPFEHHSPCTPTHVRRDTQLWMHMAVQRDMELTLQRYRLMHRRHV